MNEQAWKNRIEESALEETRENEDESVYILHFKGMTVKGVGLIDGELVSYATPKGVGFLLLR